MTSAILGHAGWILRENPLTAIAAAGGLCRPDRDSWAVIAPFDPVASDVPHALAAPDARHWFGTDQLGRDIFYPRVVATRLDLAIAASAVSALVCSRR